MELRGELATKAIGIVGSPRKNGNVDRLVQKVLDGAEEAGYQTMKYILNEMNYFGCQACDYCKSAEECRIDDDLSGLLEDNKGSRRRRLRLADILLALL